MKRWPFYIFVLYSITCHSQNTVLNDLFSALKKAKEDTNKINIYNKLGSEYLSAAVGDSCRLYYQLASELSDKLNFKKGKALAVRNIGTSYYYEGNFPEANKYYLAALKIHEELGDKAGIASCYNNLGNVYDSQEDFTKALEYQSKGLNMKIELNDRPGMAMSYNNMGLVLLNLKRFDESLENLNAGLKIMQELKDTYSIATAFSNISTVYSDLGNYELALKYEEDALKLRAQINDKAGLAKSYINLAADYEKVKRYTEAEKYALKGLSLAKEIGYMEVADVVYQTLSMICEKTGRHQKALEYYKSYVTTRDSIFNEENTRKTLQEQLQFDYDKKEAALKLEQYKKDVLVAEQEKIKELELSRSRYLAFALVVLLVLAIGFGFLFIRQNKLRSKQQSIELEQKLLRSQMNPHFIFNSLQAIQNYILRHDQKEAVKYLSSFANITRSVLENSRMEMIPLKKEVSLLENYLHLQKLRFGNRFNYQIHVDPHIDVDNIELPPMLSQPFIENALEHGMKDIDEGGQIDVYFTVKENNLLLEIKDNGKGMQAKDVSVKQHRSLAMAITKERIELMNRKSNKKTLFDIGEAFPMDPTHKGVKVQFSIPL